MEDINFAPVVVGIHVPNYRRRPPVPEGGGSTTDPVTGAIVLIDPVTGDLDTLLLYRLA